MHRLGPPSVGGSFLVFRSTEKRKKLAEKSWRPFFFAVQKRWKNHTILSPLLVGPVGQCIIFQTFEKLWIPSSTLQFAVLWLKVVRNAVEDLRPHFQRIAVRWVFFGFSKYTYLKWFGFFVLHVGNTANSQKRSGMRYLCFLQELLVLWPKFLAN